MPQVTLQPGQQQTIDVAGRFVFIESATAKVYVGARFPSSAEHELRGSESGIVLDPRDQARWEERFDSLRLINQGAAAQTIEIKVSDAQYFPKQDGGEVIIAGQNAPVEIVFDPLSPPQEVTINGGISASIDSQGVVLQVEENAPTAIVNGGPQVPGTGAGYTVAANPDRIYTMLRCAAANDGGPMFVEGVPLYAGDPAMRIDGSQAINIVASDADDIIYFFEVERT